MSNTAKSILNALGLAVLGLVLVNFIFFFIAYISADTSGSWSFAFKHGSFSLNDTITGYKLWSTPANILMGGIMSGVLYYYYRKRNLNAG